MYKLILFLNFYWLTLELSAQTNLDYANANPGENEYILSGDFYRPKVKSITEFKMTSDKKEEIIQKLNYNKYGYLESRVYYKNDLEIRFYQTFSYNKENRIEYVSKFNKDSILINKEYYKRDNNQRVIGFYEFSEAGDTNEIKIYKRNEVTNCTRIYSTGFGGKERLTSEKYYDSFGKLKLENTYFIDDKKDTSIYDSFEYKYDLVNHKQQIYYTDDMKKPNKHLLINTEYNDFGEIILEEKFLSNGTVLSKLLNTYTYDKKNNVIKLSMTQIYENKESTFELNYKIEYY